MLNTACTGVFTFVLTFPKCCVIGRRFCKQSDWARRCVTDPPLWRAFSSLWVWAKHHHNKATAELFCMGAKNDSLTLCIIRFFKPDLAVGLLAWERLIHFRRYCFGHHKALNKKHEHIQPLGLLWTSCYG